MELRVLQYFLAVTREQSILGAAESLHLSQPTLSRQIKDMEEELGKQLFIRSNRRITLTEEGMILRKRAEEILSLVQRTQEELSISNDMIAGDIYIGGGESDGMRYMLRAAQKIQDEHPLVHFHVISGDQETVIDQLDRGLIDFGILYGDFDHSKYELLNPDYTDYFGVLMRKDDPLASKDVIENTDLAGKPLIISRQIKLSDLEKQLNLSEKDINIVATYNLLFNGSLMVDEGMGYAICFDKIINTTGDSSLIFKPFAKQFISKPTIVWKKYQVFSKASQKYLQICKEMLASK
ncbi:transcriptional regulator, LysR family [Lachnospiraceae bacterium TWA4]|nr:transcriptional regulator, LysR family [Lachnospiraceae bacterium TWA4]